MAMARAVTRRAQPPSRQRTTPVSAGPGLARVGAIDALRAVALLMMFAYHFVFDLRYYRVIAADFEHDPFWLGFRALIVTSFMTLVGISIVLADVQHVPFSRFLRRVGWIAAGALAATAASWITFPASFIYFGILHCIALTSLLAWPLRRTPYAAMALGIGLLAAGLAFTSPFFDAKHWSWIGFMTHKPFTEDYVPLAPWSAATFIGIAIGHALVRTRFRLLAVLDGTPGWLRWMGRHSLIMYLAHQPIFLAVLWLALAH